VYVMLSLAHCRWHVGHFQGYASLFPCQPGVVPSVVPAEGMEVYIEAVLLLHELEHGFSGLELHIAVAASGTGSTCWA
jgi:hypothetical protein